MIDSNIECNEEIIDFGTLYLEAEWKEYISNNGNEDIIFKNADDSEVKFVPLYPPLSHNFLQSGFKLTCENGGTNNYVYTREKIAVSHKCEELDLQYYMNLLVFNSTKQAVFVDFFSLTFHTPETDNIIDTSINLNFVVNYKDNSNLDSSGFHSTPYELIDEIRLLGKTFNDVYKVVEPEENILTELYFNPKYGIVGFKDLDSELWVFDRIE